MREYLRARDTVKLADIERMMAQILGALDYAHARGVVHRDIKPGNIIVTLDGRLKVTDFGIARLDTTNLTQTGMIVGTPSYMAPEQYAGSDVDNRADLFSAGVMLYEMIVGIKPFTGGPGVISHQICHQPHAPLSQVDPSLPPALDAVIDRALAKDKQERFATAAEFARALHAAVTGANNGAEATVIATAVRPAPLIGETTSMPAGWSPDALRGLEDALLPHIGPVARTIVKRSAAKSFNAAALIEVLVNTLDGEEERRRFTSRARAILDQTHIEGNQSTADAPTLIARRGLPEADLELAASRLAYYLGPIAKVLVKKAAARADDEQSLYAALAGHLDDAQERERFLREAAAAKR
jgi:serine/threonine-protein kinase